MGTLDGLDEDVGHVSLTGLSVDLIPPIEFRELNWDVKTVAQPVIIVILFFLSSVKRFDFYLRRWGIVFPSEIHISPIVAPEKGHNEALWGAKWASSTSSKLSVAKLTSFFV